MISKNYDVFDFNQIFPKWDINSSLCPIRAYNAHNSLILLDVPVVYFEKYVIIQKGSFNAHTTLLHKHNISNLQLALSLNFLLVCEIMKKIAIDFTIAHRF
jgi:hypothetical protein